MTDILHRLQNLSDDERAKIGRIMRGEANNDMIRRGDVLEAIRSLRTNPVPSAEFQRGLGAVTKAVLDINPMGSEQ